MYTRHPNIRWLAAHAGGILPYIAFRTGLLAITPALAQTLGIAGADDSSPAFRELFYDTALSHAPQSMKAVRELAGTRHILFAADWPFSGPLFPTAGDPTPQLDETFPGDLLPSRRAAVRTRRHRRGRARDDRRRRARAEIVDSRVRDWRITLVDTVADNASSAGLVYGPWTRLRDAPDLAAVTADLIVDGERVATGSGREVLGHPAAAVAWLANTLAAFGTALEPGQVVLPGAMTTAPFVRAGQKVEARFDGLGPVSVTFV